MLKHKVSGHEVVVGLGAPVAVAHRCRSHSDQREVFAERGGHWRSSWWMRPYFPRSPPDTRPTARIASATRLMLLLRARRPSDRKHDRP